MRRCRLGGWNGRRRVRLAGTAGKKKQQRHCRNDLAPRSTEWTLDSIHSLMISDLPF
jgi:hypothetical protein